MESSSKKPTPVLTAVAVLLTLFAIVSVIKLWQVGDDDDRDPVAATGTVVKIEISKGEYGDVYTPRVKYTDHAAVSHNVLTINGVSNPDFKVGSKVELLYVPGEEDEVALDDGSFSAGLTIPANQAVSTAVDFVTWLVFAVTFSLSAFAFWMYRWHKRRINKLIDSQPV